MLEKGFSTIIIIITLLFVTFGMIVYQKQSHYETTRNNSGSANTVKEVDNEEPIVITEPKEFTDGGLYQDEEMNVSFLYPDTFKLVRYEKRINILPKTENSNYSISINHRLSLELWITEASKPGRSLEIDGNTYNSQIYQFGEGNSGGSYFAEVEWIEFPNGLVVVIEKTSRTRNDKHGNMIDRSAASDEIISAGEEIVRSIKFN